MSDMWYILFPEPPRFLQFKFLSRHAGRATAWLAFLNVQASIAVVPGLLWYIAGRKPVALPWTHTQLQPSQQPYHAALLLCLFLALTYVSLVYLSALRRRQAEREQDMLTPESITGQTSDVQQAWTADSSHTAPQGDASSLPVDRSMQQPSDVRHHDFRQEDVQDIFRKIHNLKQRLYGSNADVTIKGQRDLATAAAETDRLCSALGIPSTDSSSHTAKSLREKLANLKAEVG